MTDDTYEGWPDRGVVGSAHRRPAVSDDRASLEPGDDRPDRDRRITGTVLSFEMGVLWPNFTATSAASIPRARRTAQPCGGEGARGAHQQGPAIDGAASGSVRASGELNVKHCAAPSHGAKDPMS
jgi:hypothetical protein